MTNIQTIPTDQWEHEERGDMGDYEYCSGCEEYILPDTRTEINYDVHRVITWHSCHYCGEEWEVE